MASEFGSIEATQVPRDQLVDPGPALDPLPGPIPSFQDLTDSSGDERDGDDDDWEAIVRAGSSRPSQISLVCTLPVSQLKLSLSLLLPSQPRKPSRNNKYRT